MLEDCANRRKHLRVAWRLLVELRSVPDGRPFAATALNVATGGMALHCHSARPTDTIVEVRCELPDGVHVREMRIPALVRRCTADPREGYVLAVEFRDLEARDRAYVRSCVVNQALRQIQALSEYPAFRSAAELDLLELASVSHECRLAPGDAAVRHGDEADGVFLVKRGRIELRPLGLGDAEVETVHPGQVFGEVQTLLGLPHDRDAVATEETTELLVFPGASLAFLREHNPHLALVLYEIFVAFLGRRVRRLTSRLGPASVAETPIRSAGAPQAADRRTTI